MEPPTFITTIIFAQSGVPLAKWRDGTWLFSRKKQKFMPRNNSATIQKKNLSPLRKNARSLGLNAAATWIMTGKSLCVFV